MTDYRKLYLYSTLLTLIVAVALFIGALFDSILAIMIISWVLLTGVLALSLVHLHQVRQSPSDAPPRNVTYLSGTDVVKALYAHIFDSSTPIEEVDRWVDLLGSLYGDAWEHREKLWASNYLKTDEQGMEEELRAFVDDWERKIEGG